MSFQRQSAYSHMIIIMIHVNFTIKTMFDCFYVAFVQTNHVLIVTHNYTQVVPIQRTQFNLETGRILQYQVMYYCKNMDKNNST